MNRLNKIVLTGAAGNLGNALREPLSKMAHALVSTDLADEINTPADNETYVKADLGDLSEITNLLEGADMVVHFGAIPDEAPWDDILHSNIIGAYNVWEAAFRNNLRRVIYASSIHAVGMYPKNQFIDTGAPHRPDTFYGLSKCFAEDLGRMYWEKRQLESVCLRIYSCTPTPQNARAIGSWLSYDDLIQLVERCITTPVTGFAVAWGISNNDRAPVDNSRASFLGYKPKDNAENFAKEIFAKTPALDPADSSNMCHGGPFAVVPLGESGVAAIKRMSENKKQP